MIGLDTNVLVRYIMQDDVVQSAKATQLIEALTAEHPGFVTMVSVVELVWVLDSSYGLERSNIVQSLEALLRTKELIVDAAPVVSNATRGYKATSADFADCLIHGMAQHAGCDRTMTCDKGAARNAGMTLVM